MAVLGNLIEQVRGVSYKPEDLHDTLNENSIALLRANNIKDGKLNFDDVVYVDKKKVSAKQLLRAGDVLICASSGSKELVGKAAYVDTDLPMTFGAFCKVVRPKTECPRYVGHYFNSPYYRERITNSAAGANINNIRNEHIDVLEIIWPSTEKQLAVVTVLDKVTALIDFRKEQIAKLDELVKSRFVEMFGDLEHTVFPKCKMAEIADIKHGYAFSGEFFTEEDNNILLVTPGNFKIGGGFQEKKCKFYTGEYPDEFILHSGDLIVTMTDLSKRMDTLGYAAIVPQTERVYLHNQRIGLFINISNLINKTFMMHFMQTNDYRDKVVASSTGSTVHHTSPTKILDCEIFVPPIELQSKFASFVEQTDKTKLTIQASLDKLEVMKKALMQEYFG